MNLDAALAAVRLLQDLVQALEREVYGLIDVVVLTCTGGPHWRSST